LGGMLRYLTFPPPTMPLTINPATALVLDGLQILHVSGPQARYGSLARRRVPAGQAVV